MALRKLTGKMSRGLLADQGNSNKTISFSQDGQSWELLRPIMILSVFPDFRADLVRKARITEGGGDEEQIETRNENNTLRI